MCLLSVSGSQASGPGRGKPDPQGFHRRRHPPSVQLLGKRPTAPSLQTLCPECRPPAPPWSFLHTAVGAELSGGHTASNLPAFRPVCPLSGRWSTEGLVSLQATSHRPCHQADHVDGGDALSGVGSEKHECVPRGVIASCGLATGESCPLRSWATTS